MGVKGAERVPTGDTKDYVFVSYARQDRAVVDRALLEPMARAGIDVWLDDHIEWDASWWEDVRRHLKDAHAVVVAMTVGAETSEWVAREVTIARETGASIFPVLIDGDGLAELATAQHLDLRGAHEVPDEWLAAVRRRLRRGRGARLARRAVRQTLLVVIPVVTAVIALVEFVIPLFTDDDVPLPTFAADYGIGVAAFPVEGEGDLREDLDAEVASFQSRLVSGVERALDAEQAAEGANAAGVGELTIEVLPIPRSSPSAPDDDTGAAAWAVDLATDSGADALVFGVIEVDGSRLIARPAVFLDSSSLPRAEELAGTHQLGPIEHDLSAPTSSVQLRREIADLGATVAALAEIVRLYDSNRFEQALARVEQVRAAESTFDADGLLSIIEGNLHGKLGDAEAAESAYASAAGDPRTSERAQLGLAQVRYAELLGADGTCDAGTDVAAMLAVAGDYDALEATASHPGANLATKAALGAGRARVCLAAAGLIPDAAGAIADLEAVVETYDRERGSDGDLRELAAEAEALLGVAAMSADEVDRDLDEVLVHFDRAIELTTFSDRLVAFHVAKADALSEFGESERACDEVDEAVDLVDLDDGERLRERYRC